MKEINYNHFPFDSLLTLSHVHAFAHLLLRGVMIWVGGHAAWSAHAERRLMFTLGFVIDPLPSSVRPRQGLIQNARPGSLCADVAAQRLGKVCVFDRSASAVSGRIIIR